MKLDSGPIGWYREIQIQFANGRTTHIEIERRESGTHIPIVAGGPAPWTRLGFHKCPCCPIPFETGPCPAALSLQTTLDRLRHHASTEIVTATATDDLGRQQTVTWPLQLVGAILVQLAVFASECPVGRRVKPYVQGLPPFTPSDQLLKLVLERLLGAQKGSAEATRGAVKDIIEPLHQVFIYLLRRLRGDASPGEDAIPNSIVHVDTFAQMMTYRAQSLTDQVATELGWKAPSPRGGVWARIQSLWK